MGAGHLPRLPPQGWLLWLARLSLATRGHCFLGNQLQLLLLMTWATQAQTHNPWSQGSR